MVGKVVGESARADALVARDVQVVVGHSTVAKMNSRAGAVHPDAAKPGSPGRDRPFTTPTFRVSILAVNRQVERGRVGKLPFSQELIELRRNQRTQDHWADVAIEVETEIVRCIQNLGLQGAAILA